MLVIGVGLITGDVFSKVSGGIHVIFSPSRNTKKVQLFITGVFEGGIREFINSLLIAITSVTLTRSITL